MLAVAPAEPLRILLIDDDADDSALTRDMVAEIRGFPTRFEWEKTYDGGLTALRRNRSDICLLDYKLGAKDGLMLLGEARRGGCTIPVILLTGQGKRDTDVSALKGGADDYLAKGDLNPELLERTIRYARERAAHVERLRASEQRYRTLFESSADGILIAELETKAIRYANHAIARMLGYTETELCALNAAELFPKESFPRVLARFQAAARGEPTDADTTCLRKDGSAVAAEVTGTAITMDGRTMIAGFFRDVTERKRGEAERRRLATAIEQADMMVLITDAKGAIEYVNPAFETVTGYGRADVLGRNPRLLKSNVQDAAFYRALWATVAGGNTWRGRLVNRKKDGTLYTEASSISPVRDTTGAITSYVAVKRDITATLALEAHLRQAQKMEAVGRLAGGVAHDFNNVLSVILSYAELIGSDLKPDEPLHGDIGEIKSAALRATALTRQLLAFSRQQVLETKVLNLNQGLVGTEKMLGRLLGADIELRVLPAIDLWNIKADPGQIEQIVMNLAVNARDAMPQGGKLTIETRNVELDEAYAHAHPGVAAGAYVKMSVSDTGTGMDQDTLARIFEPFFTTKDEAKGTGLGLATVFGIVRQSGGHIWVYSEPGTGTTFKVYFPRVADVADVITSRPPALASQRGTETILLVEDDDQVRAIARDILRRLGYLVLEAPNGGEALLICEQHGAKIHLLVTDVVLPRMSGRQLAERLATLRPAMKVLFMSGYTDDAILHHGILDSGVAFLQKPLTPTSLARKVRAVLDKAAA